MTDELRGGTWVPRAGIKVYRQPGRRVRLPMEWLAPGPCINCGHMAIGLRCRTCRDEMERTQKRQHREAA